MPKVGWQDSTPAAAVDRRFNGSNARLGSCGDESLALSRELASSDQQTVGGRGTTRVFFLGEVAAGLAATPVGLRAAWHIVVAGMRIQREVLGGEWSRHGRVGFSAKPNDWRL